MKRLLCVLCIYIYIIVSSRVFAYCRCSPPNFSIFFVKCLCECVLNSNCVELQACVQRIRCTLCAFQWFKWTVHRHSQQDQARKSNAIYDVFVCPCHTCSHTTIYYCIHRVLDKIKIISPILQDQHACMHAGWC